MDDTTLSSRDIAPRAEPRTLFERVYIITPRETIAEATPATRQTLLFSATLDGGIAGLARKLLRDSRIDEAVGMIENAVHEYPENTGVLLQAAQIQCMALRLKKAHDDQRTETIRDYLDRLDKLLPGHDRVNMMRRYFRETLSTLDGVSLAH